MTLEDLRQAKPPAEETRSFWQQAVSDVAATGKDLQSGLFQSLGSLDAVTANTFMVMDEASRALSRATGLERGQAFERMEQFFRDEAEVFRSKARDASSGRQGIPARVNRILGALPVGLATAGAAATAGGPTAGFAALGALESADRGVREAALGAAKGGAVGRLFKVTEGLAPASRAGSVGTGASTLESATGASPGDASLSGATTGLLAGLGGKRPELPRRSEAPTRRSLLEEAARKKAHTRGAKDLRRRAEERRETEAERPRIEEARRAPEDEGPLVRITPAESRAAADAVTNPSATSPVRGKVVNLNLDRIKGPEDFKRAQSELVQFFKPQIDAARRDRITLTETSEMARDLGLTPKELLQRRRGQAFNAEEITASRTMMQSIMSELKQTADKVRDPSKRAAGEGRQELDAKLMRLMTLYEATSEQVLGATAEAGRALSALRIQAGSARREVAQIKELVQNFEGQLRTGRSEDPMGTFADMIATMPTDTARSKFVREARKVTTSDKLLETWINGLLSNPQTHAVNLISNATVALYSIPEAFVASQAGAFRSGMAHLRGRPAPERVFTRETDARLFGLIEGTREGLAAGWHVLRTGEPSDLLTKIEVPRQGAVRGRLGQAIRIPGRALQAGDEFFKSIGFRQEINALAARSASREGLRGREWRERVAELQRNPTDKMSENAIQRARLQTFTNPLGPTGKAIMSFSNSHPLAKMVLPFLRTPTNIFKFAFERTPLGLGFKEVRENLRKGGSARDSELAKMALGSAMGIWAATEAAKGNITGSGPANPEVRNAWFTSGKQPYSIKVGDRWVSFSRIEPISTILGLAADFSEVAGHMDERTAEETATKIALSFRMLVENKTFVRGLTNAANAIMRPIGGAPEFLGDLAGSAVPSGVSNVTRRIDPVLRDSRGIIDTVKSRLPAYSKTVPPRRNIWGEPIFLDGGLGPDFISPFYQSKEVPDLATEEVVRVKARLSKPGKTIQGVEVNREEHDALVRISGQVAKRAIDRLVRNPEYRFHPDAIKREAIEEIYSIARESARTEVFLGIAQEDPGRVVEPVLERIQEIRGEAAP